MTIPDMLAHARIRLEYDIDARADAAQQAGKRLAEHHRRALGQKWRKAERDLLQPWDARPREG